MTDKKQPDKIRVLLRPSSSTFWMNCDSYLKLLNDEYLQKRMDWNVVSVKHGALFKELDKGIKSHINDAMKRGSYLHQQTSNAIKNKTPYTEIEEKPVQTAVRWVEENIDLEGTFYTSEHSIALSIKNETHTLIGGTPDLFAINDKAETPIQVVDFKFSGSLYNFKSDSGFTQVSCYISLLVLSSFEENLKGLTIDEKIEYLREKKLSASAILVVINNVSGEHMVKNRSFNRQEILEEIERLLVRISSIENNDIPDKKNEVSLKKCNYCLKKYGCPFFVDYIEKTMEDADKQVDSFEPRKQVEHYEKRSILKIFYNTLDEVAVTTCEADKDTATKSGMKIKETAKRAKWRDEFVNTPHVDEFYLKRPATFTHLLSIGIEELVIEKCKEEVEEGTYLTLKTIK